MQAPAISAHPRGMILAFTLIILLLVSMMGMAILMNSRTELSISANTAQGREAFSQADTAARIAVLMTRVMFNSGDFGNNLSQVETNADDGLYRQPMFAEYSNDFFNLANLRNESANNFDFRRRYIRAGSWVGRGADRRDDGDDRQYTYEPHLVFRAPEKGQARDAAPVVATASVSMFVEIDRGGSLGIDNYGDSGVSLSLYTTVSVNGRAIPRYTPQGQSQGDNASEAFDSEDSTRDEPHSVVTILFREMQ